jgi:hypothetical protein
MPKFERRRNPKPQIHPNQRSDKMRIPIFAGSAALLLVSCSTLPVPGPGGDTVRSNDAISLLRKSASLQGDSWSNYRSVEVAYEGKWSDIATRLQPVLTDRDFRKCSIEIYQPSAGLVSQTHRGPQGTKEVNRRQRRVSVRFNGVRSTNPEVLDSSALVADAYTVFLFGSSWLAQNGRDLRCLENRSIGGELCSLVAGRLSPGLGNSHEDHFIAWISSDSGILKRFQFSLNGFESTRGADVDVVFSNHWKAADGSIWPGRFVEHIQRPLFVKAHEWKMTSLKLDGVKCDVP